MDQVAARRHRSRRARASSGCRTLSVNMLPTVTATPPRTRCSSAAGIRRARGIVAALTDDKDNLFIVVSARQLNPRLAHHRQGRRHGGVREAQARRRRQRRQPRVHRRRAHGVGDDPPAGGRVPRSHAARQGQEPPHRGGDGARGLAARRQAHLRGADPQVHEPPRRRGARAAGATSSRAASSTTPGRRCASSRTWRSSCSARPRASTSCAARSRAASTRRRRNAPRQLLRARDKRASDEPARMPVGTTRAPAMRRRNHRASGPRSSVLL